jgi:chemotaxis protein MotA
MRLQEGGAGHDGERLMDLSTIIGLVVGPLMVIGGLIIEGGSISDITQPTAAMIVLGGTMGALLVQFPMPIVIQSFKSFKHVFIDHAEKPDHVIDQIVEFANKARKEGLVALEGDVRNVDDAFFKKAMMMAIDGASMKDVQETLELELGYMEEYGEHPIKFFEAAGAFAPTMGIVGAVMGLIQVMKNLQDIEAVGHGIGVAFVATIYALLVANWIFLPASGKLKVKHRMEIIMKEMIVSGVLLIIEGINPRVIKDKLYNFFDEEVKASKEQKAS